MNFFRFRDYPGQGAGGMAPVSAGKPYREPGSWGLTLRPWFRSNHQKPKTPAFAAGRDSFPCTEPGGDRRQDRLSCNLWREFHLPPGGSRHLSLAANFSEAGDNKKKIGGILNIYRYIMKEEVFF